MLTTYPGGPNKGFWENNISASFNSMKGWATLLFHMGTMAASMLNVDRTALLIHEGSKAIYKKYYIEYGLAQQEQYYMKVQFTASPKLTQYAKTLVTQWLENRNITFGMRGQTIIINPYMI